MKKTILIGALTVLAGCGNPVTNSTGSDQSNQGSVDSASKSSEKLAVGNSAKASLCIPAEGLIADALLDPKFAGSHINGIAIRAKQTKYANSDFKSVMSAAFGKDESGYLIPVAAITQAYRAWQIQIVDQSAFGEPEASPGEKNSYLGYQEVSVNYSNDIFTELAIRANNEVGVFEDPLAAKAGIQRIYKTIQKSTLKKVWEQSIEYAANRDRTIESGASKGVEWSAGGDSYSGNADGLVWTKNGVPWFGKGSLSGKQWTICLESSISKSNDITTEDSISTKGGTGEKSSNGAQPK